MVWGCLFTLAALLPIGGILMSCDTTRRWIHRYTADPDVRVGDIWSWRSDSPWSVCYVVDEVMDGWVRYTVAGRQDSEKIGVFVFNRRLKSRASS